MKKVSTGAQTEIIRCEECEFPADCMNDLVYHMYESHPLEEDENKFECNICSDKFRTKSDLMVHKKNVHPEKVQTCLNFVQGTCPFKDDCWFRHDTQKELVLEFDCNFCEKRFLTKNEFMKHKKSNHKEYVQNCRNDIKNNCQFSSKMCWFLHQTSEKKNVDFISENEHDNKVLMKKLIKIIENYPEKIKNLDEMMTKQ